MKTIALTVEDIKKLAVQNGKDYFVVTDKNGNIKNKTEKMIKPNDYVCGKVFLKYKEKNLSAEYEEYKYIIRFVSLYKGISIIEINNKFSVMCYSIKKNISAEIEKLLFDSVKDVKAYIDSFDRYLPEDRDWFLL